MLVSFVQLGLLSLVVFVSSTVTSPEGPANGIITCRPDVEFLRDCGNKCVCHSDGKAADCTSRPCPKDFETSMQDEIDEVNAVMAKLKTEDEEPVYVCYPRTPRKINDFGGTCYCSSNGLFELCSEDPDSPWERP